MLIIISHQRTANKNHEVPLTPIQMAKIEKVDNPKCQRGCGTTGTHTLLVGM